MKRKKRVVYISLILACVLGGMLFVNRHVFLDLIGKHVKEREKINTHEELKVESGYSRNGKNRYIVHLDNDLPDVAGINPDYYVYPDMVGKERFIWWDEGSWWDARYSIYDKAQLNYYSYGSDELIRTVDLLETIDNPDFPYHITNYSSRPVVYNGKWCLSMDGYIKTKREKELTDLLSDRFYLDLETLEVYPEEERLYERYPQDILEEGRRVRWKWDFVSQRKTEPDIWENNGLGSIVCTSDDVFNGDSIKAYGAILFDSEQLPERGAKLYEEFPGLEKYCGKEGYVVELIMFDVPTNEEVLNYFVREISFEGMTLGAEHTIDGQVHEINSIDDYYLYRYGVQEGDEMPEDYWNSMGL